jgi:hypothetical protein
MNRFHQQGRRALLTRVLACILACMIVVLPLTAADPVGTASEPASTSAGSNVSDIEQLKRMLIDQQRQIDELRRQLTQQKTGSEAQAAFGGQTATTTGNGVSASAYPALGQVASTTAMLPRAAALPAAFPAPQAAPEKSATEPSPLQIKIGDATITPVGFMDITNTWRSTNAGTSLQTNFGSFPYNNTVAGRLTEDKWSAEN